MDVGVPLFVSYQQDIVIPIQIIKAQIIAADEDNKIKIVIG